MAGSMRALVSTGRKLLEMWDESLAIGSGQSHTELLTSVNKPEGYFQKHTQIFIKNIHTEGLAGRITNI